MRVLSAEKLKIKDENVKMKNLEIESIKEKKSDYEKANIIIMELLKVIIRSIKQ